MVYNIYTAKYTYRGRLDIYHVCIDELGKKGGMANRWLKEIECKLVLLLIKDLDREGESLADRY